MTEQPEKQKWNRVVPTEYEPLTRKVEVKISTIAIGVFMGNILSGVVGGLIFAMVAGQ
ncbi:hypothetical protein [Rhodococcus sp. 14-2470-1a]|uniref:hypothetical protein n=1 Tax=Rhodococcus sp. 14-2470-1a TaxID=2023150 RepID=UPI0015C603B2|nr:hypothetical protein [Rhodococcus sp. 14-2470-1a]